jgi:hypothetical protein
VIGFLFYTSLDSSLELKSFSYVFSVSWIFCGFFFFFFFSHLPCVWIQALKTGLIATSTNSLGSFRQLKQNIYIYFVFFLSFSFF